MWRGTVICWSADIVSCASRVRNYTRMPLACAEQVKRILDSQAVRLRAQERLHQEMLDFYLGPAVEDWNSFQYYARRKET